MIEPRVIAAIFSSANLVIALSYGLIPVAVIWVVTRHQNWRRMASEGVVAAILLTLFVASCGWGHWLHFRMGITQPWDVVTAGISALSAAGGMLYANNLAASIRALLDAQARELVLAQIFDNLPPATAMVLAKGDELRYLKCSSSFEGLYGLQPTPGQSHYSLFPGARADWSHLHQACLWQGQGDSQDAPVAYPKPDGTEGWLVYSLSPVLDLEAQEGEPPNMALMIWKDVSANQKLRQQVDELAYRDSLTGLHNRRFSDALLVSLFAHQERNSGPISVIAFDVDHFKLINDLYGHQAGDAVLIEVATCLRINSRGSDNAIRLAGDELIVICEADPVAALKAANRFHAAITAKPVQYEGSAIKVSISTGVATAYSGTPAELMRAADAALYVAKKSGRNQVQAGAAAKEYLQLEQDVIAAVRAEQIELYYQPILDLASGEVMGAESLSRWILNGVVEYPGRFLPIVESTEALNAAFCRAQLRRCCQQAKAWDGLWGGCLSFNLSPWGLHQEKLVEWLGGEFDAAGIDPGLIAVEATERLSILPPSLKNAITIIDESFEALLKSGYGLMLDDFGGPGSGTQLSWMVRSLAPGVISEVRVKLDRVLIGGIDINPALRQLTAGLISMIHGLGDGDNGSGLTVIAEGIETQGEADCLAEIGCDLGQGYFYGRAVPAAEFEETWFQK